jgi:hypothetical protein
MKHNLADWHASQDDIIRVLRSHVSMLKIILKTKDDLSSLTEWVGYHANIVGLENLIVFDNCSQDPAIYAFYDSLPELAAFSYRGFHNILHHTELFSPLYNVLEETCQYFVFLDGDERLALFQEDGRIVNKEMTSFLDANRAVKMFPGTWLLNDFGSRRVYKCGTPKDNLLLHGLRWGKPILRADSGAIGFINHNTQAAQAGARVFEDFRTNFFVLHLCNLSRQQRIEANRKKLVARNVIDENASIDRILTLDLSGHSDRNVTLYVSEIQKLANCGEFQSADLLSPGFLRTNDIGGTDFFSDTERLMFSDYVRFPGRYVHSLL